MGNCLKRSTADDISLLRGSESGGRESSDQLEPAPLYSVRTNLHHSFNLCFYIEYSKLSVYKKKENMKTNFFPWDKA